MARINHDYLFPVLDCRWLPYPLPCSCWAWEVRCGWTLMLGVWGRPWTRGEGNLRHNASLGSQIDSGALCCDPTQSANAERSKPSRVKPVQVDVTHQTSALTPQDQFKQEFDFTAEVGQEAVALPRSECWGQQYGGGRESEYE